MYIPASRSVVSMESEARLLAIIAARTSARYKSRVTRWDEESWPSFCLAARARLASAAALRPKIFTMNDVLKASLSAQPRLPGLLSYVVGDSINHRSEERRV